MKSATLQHLETLLHTRKLGRTLDSGTTAAPGGAVTTGMSDLDAWLGGGWPAGAVSELVGAPSSGRTRTLVSTLAQATRAGAVVALVDSCDRFDPRGAAEAGVRLDRVLWVRGASVTVEGARPDVLDRLVRQAVRATDLILRAGGFSIVALDLADVPAPAVRRLPAATWLRLAHVNEGRPTAGLVIGREPGTRSARGVSVRIEATPIWTGASAQARRLAGWRTTYHVPTARLRPAAARCADPAQPLESWG